MVPRRLFWLSDFLVLLLAFVAAHRITALVQLRLRPGEPLAWPFDATFRSPAAELVPPLHSAIWIFLAAAPVTLIALGFMGAYRSLFEQSLAAVLFTGIVAPLAGLSVVTAGIFAVQSGEWSRLFVFMFVAWCQVALVSYRLVLRAYVHWRLHRGAYVQDMLLVGSPARVKLLEQLIVSVRPRQERHHQVMGYLRSDELPPIEQRPDTQCLGTVNQLNTLLVRRSIHEVIVVASEGDFGSDWMAQVMGDCDQVSVPLRIIPAAVMTTTLNSLHVLVSPGPVPLPALSLVPPVRPSEALFVKRLLDIVVSSTLLAVLSPLMAVIAVAIRFTSPGPIFYRWNVIGKHGHEFTGYKFRTMVQDADALKVKLLDRNEMSGPVFKVSRDPRITPLGAFLRKYSLDELPQLYSVLVGDMSLVGPRPAFRSELERYEFWQMRKLSTKPGITCLWQIRGRNNISDFNDWVRMDLEYIDRWTIWLDLKIMVRTAWTVLAGTGR
jgi:exopolysaccharide biosynthesis polyprenyl glycosylphosphotransferase